MKILEIGPERTPQADKIPGWEDAEVLTLDIDPEFEPDILCDAADIPDKWHGEFDGVLASHVLEHFPYNDIQGVVDEWARLLKGGGQLHIVVPSLEWAARQILIEDTSPALFPHMYGSQINEYQVHMSGFTMRLLRLKMAKADLMVQRARTGDYDISINGKVFQARQHYVMGVKPSEDE